MRPGARSSRRAGHKLDRGALSRGTAPGPGTDRDVLYRGPGGVLPAARPPGLAGAVLLRAVLLPLRSVPPWAGRASLSAFGAGPLIRLELARPGLLPVDAGVAPSRGSPRRYYLNRRRPIRGTSESRWYLDR